LERRIAPFTYRAWDMDASFSAGSDPDEGFGGSTCHIFLTKSAELVYSNYMVDNPDVVLGVKPLDIDGFDRRMGVVREGLGNLFVKYSLHIPELTLGKTE
jgi:hypothetical protein